MLQAGPGQTLGGVRAGCGPGPRAWAATPPRDGVVGHLVGRICKRNPTLISEVNFPVDFFVKMLCVSLCSGIACLMDKKITNKSTEFFTEFSTGFFTEFFTGSVPCPFRHPPSNMHLTGAQGPPRTRPGPTRGLPRGSPGPDGQGPPGVYPGPETGGIGQKSTKTLKIRLIRSIRVKPHTNPCQIVAKPLETKNVKLVKTIINTNGNQ